MFLAIRRMAEQNPTLSDVSFPFLYPLYYIYIILLEYMYNSRMNFFIIFIRVCTVLCLLLFFGRFFVVIFFLIRFF